MRKVRMMRKSTSAMPSDRIQLSNHRANVDRRFSGGAKGTGAGCALEPALRAPNSCMAFTLAKAAARSNSHRPPPGCPPAPDAVPKRVRRVAVPHAGGETRSAPLEIHPHPHQGTVHQGAKRLHLDRCAPVREAA